MSSHFKYTVGLNNVGSYQVSGIPFASGSLSATSGNALEIQFPYVTSWVQIINHSATNELTCSFSEAGLTGNNHFKIHASHNTNKEGGYHPTLNLKITSLFFTGSDNFDVIGIPANTYVVAAGCDVLTADTAGNTGTIAVGDSASSTAYVSAVAPTSATQLTPANTTGKAYASANDIRLTVGTGAINAKVRVWAIMISLDKGGTEKDTESQSVTFA